MKIYCTNIWKEKSCFSQFNAWRIISRLLNVITGVYVQFSVMKPFVKLKVTNCEIALIEISFFITGEFCNTLRAT